MTAPNGIKSDPDGEKKPGVVRKISKITFTIGPIRQEDLSTPEINKLMAMAQRFDITFDTVPVLDSDQTDKLGYITLPFEIRTQEYLLVLYDRLTNLKLAPNRDVSVKFPEELKKYVEETRTEIHEQKKRKIEEEKQKAEKARRSVFATWVDKDTGRDSLVEKFPEAKEITLRQHNFQWFGCIEFESADKALEAMKLCKNKLEIEGQEVKLVRTAPDAVEEKKTPVRSPATQNRKRPMSTGGIGALAGGRGGQRSPRPLLASSPGSGFGRMGGMGGGMGGMGGGMGRGLMGMSPGYGGGNYNNYSGGYSGGYGNQGFSSGGAGNFQLGAKRKSDLGEFGGSPKKPFGTTRGGFGGGRGGYGRY